jgi:penicillin-binding protein 1A
MSTSPSMTGTIKEKIRHLLAIEKPWVKKGIKYIWIAFLCLVFGLPLFIFTVRIDLFGLYGGMPSLAQVENPENDLSSELISADGVSLGRYFRFNRSQVTFQQLSPELVNTLILSEDHRFYNHQGIDLPAYLRVIYGLFTFNLQGGGSTITQQLAKNLYTQNPDKSLDGFISKLGKYPKRTIEKVKEWMISVDLERNFTKEEIIAMYFNTSEFGNNSYGIKVASETYFNKTPDSLNVQESAMLVGMLQAPSYFNPNKWPERATNKRNEVLRKLQRHQFILKTDADYDSVAALPLGLDFKVLNQNQGLATYFRTELSKYLMEFCKERDLDLWESGLKIYTTIDSRMQKYAEEAMQEHMKPLQADFTKMWGGRNPWVDDDNRVEIKGYLDKRMKRTEAYKNLVKRYGEGHDSVKIMLRLKKPMTVFSYKGDRDTLFSSYDSLNYYLRFLQAGFMAMDPATGHVKAWVGGVNFKYFKYDHVQQSTRQPGSTFKPFVYGLAIENQYSPCFKLADVSHGIKVSGGVWTVKNSDGKETGEEMTIRQAMARSVNTITAQLIDKLEPINVVEFAKKFGITTPLDPVPSLCLGTSDVNLFEITAAYSAFANLGMYTRPFFVTRIEDKYGNVIANFIPQTHQATDEQTAYKMVYMFKGGVEERMGTSGGLNYSLREDNEVGGKTGTTDNASDGWYIGLTHNLVAGAWVGGDERFIHFPSWQFGAGARTARPIWEKFMLKVYADPTTGITKGQFKRPESGVDASMDCHYVSKADSIQKAQKPIEFY